MSPDLRTVLRADPVLAQLIEAAGAAPVYVVGGVVRDLLRGAEPGPDVDVVIEGDAVRVARSLAHRLGTRPRTHPRFRTAEVPSPDGRVLDIATARIERYSAPGALPDVEPADIRADLARRDFTVNAMAVGLGPDAHALLDPHGGSADLAAGVVRSIRPGAFAEDPSRVVRGARYCARLGFSFDPATRAEAEAGARTLDPVSARVADELTRLATEDCAPRALGILAEIGVPWISVPDDAVLAAVPDVLRWAGAPDVPAWHVRLGFALTPEAAAVLAVPGAARRAIVSVGAAPELAADLSGRSRGEVDRVLTRAAPAAVVAAAALGADGVADWWASGRDLRLRVDGGDLVALGLSGPAVGRRLARLRELALDGDVPDDRNAQLAWAKEDG